MTNTVQQELTHQFARKTKNKFATIPHVFAKTAKRTKSKRLRLITFYFYFFYLKKQFTIQSEIRGCYVSSRLQRFFLVVPDYLLFKLVVFIARVTLQCSRQIEVSMLQINKFVLRLI